MGRYVDYIKESEQPIGSGGNANVYLAQNKITGERVALKELKTGGRYFEEKKNRFCIESRLVQKIQDSVTGVIPIFDSGLPDENNNQKYWYTMPIAQPISEKFKENVTVDDIAGCIIELAQVMVELHQRGIVHRDIKPSNIYFYNGRYCFGDFGLVDYPEKEDLTKLKESVGAKATIAPEMKRNASQSDGKKADVYSLAKTLWMMLTGNDTGFDGTYDSESKLMGLANILKNDHLIELEELLYDATREEPELRPTMKEFSERLTIWLDTRSDFDKSNLSQWKYIQNTLFGKIIPDTAKWTNIDDIIMVLNLLGKMPNLNHMFIPSGGGQDFEYAERAEEEDCICIKSLGNVILKPKSLYAENIEKDYIWSYFRLELEELPPVSEQHNIQTYETLTEDVPGHYVSWICGNYGYYEDDKPLPKGYRTVQRYIKGSFVIFSKSSVYNDISGTYDARHSKMTTEQFRDYIFHLRKMSHILPYEIFLKGANKNPFGSDLDSEEKREERKKKRERYKKCRKFIEQNYEQWNLLEGIPDYINIQDGKLSYYFRYAAVHDFFNYSYLCCNGKIQKETNDCERYIVNSRDDAIKFEEKLCSIIKKKCENANIEFDLGYEQLFEIGIQRVGKPTHLFTLEELETKLRNGDDFHNNRLVIDENGFIQLIPECENPHLYPVRFEEFCAYNNYVGKYADLSDLSEEYLMCLQGWLIHLKTGKTVYMDYVHDNKDIEKIIEEIKAFY